MSYVRSFRTYFSFNDKTSAAFSNHELQLSNWEFGPNCALNLITFMVLDIFVEGTYCSMPFNAKLQSQNL